MKQFLSTLLAAASLSVSAQTWQPCASGLNSSTHGMCLYNNTLVDVGSFGSPCGRVASWDGTSWSCFAGGVGLVGRAAIEYNGDLVVCGDFWNINQPCTGCNGVARWDGSAWQPLGTGFNNDVLCLAVWNGMLVAGGDFTTCDGNPCSRIAVWNGTNWSALGGVNDFDNDIRGLAVYNGELWAGGDFSNVAGNTPSDRVVKWNGSAWVGGNSGVDIPGGLDSTVRCFYVDQQANLLYMGGHFLEVGGNTNCRGVAVYDGNAWQPLGTGVDNYVRALGKYNGNIIVGGDFLNAGTTPASKIAKWNPNTQTWSAMGAGMNDYVKAIEVYNGELYAGGPFTTADGLPRSCVARWYEQPPPVASFTASLNNICSGQCISFTDNSTNSPGSWTWTFNGASPSSSTQQNPSTICYSSPGTYTVSLQACNSSGCHTTTQVITVNNGTPPNVGVTAAQSTICAGYSTSLTASGATTYTWSPASGLSSTTGATVTASPTVTTTYTVTGTAGCSATNTITVTVNQGPVMTAVAASPSICPGGSTAVTANGATSYTWSPASGLSSTSGATVTASPTVTTTYTVTGTGSNGCTSTQTVMVTVLVPAALPLVEGFQSLTFLPVGWVMNDSGNDGNVWQHNTSVGGFGNSSSCAMYDNNSINAPGTRDEMRTMKMNLTSLTTATMTFDVAYAHRNGGGPYDTLNVYISTDCDQTWTLLYSKGGNTLVTSGNTNSAFVPAASEWRTETVSLNAYIGQPSVTFAFQNRNHNSNNLYIDNINITGTNTNPPTPAFSLSSATTCPGGCITVTDNTSGLPTSWNWTFTGASPSSSTQQNPGSVCYSTAGTYTITLQACNGNGCNTTTQTVTVAQPVASAGADVSVCGGSSTTLSAGGGGAYQWQPASGLNCSSCQSPVATPAATTIYTVTVTDVNGCSASDAVVVTVFNVNADAGANQMLCMGYSTTLNASGGVTYSWTPADSLSCTTCASPVASPTVTTTYTVTVTDINGCTATDTVQVTVNICTGINAPGTSGQVMVYPNPAAGMVSIVWPGISNGELSVYNMLGEIHLQEKLSGEKTNISLAGLPAGVYVFRIRTPNGQLTERVVKE